MAPLIIIVVLGLLGWLAFLAVRSLKRRGVGWPWWAVLGVCLIIGLVAGVWFGYCFEYQPEPTLRVTGFPLPSALFVHKVDADGVERWEDYPIWFNAILDILLFSFVSVSFAWLANALWRLVHGRGEKSNSDKSPQIIA